MVGRTHGLRPSIHLWMVKQTRALCVCKRTVVLCLGCCRCWARPSSSLSSWPGNFRSVSTSNLLRRRPSALASSPLQSEVGPLTRPSTPPSPTSSLFPHLSCSFGWFGWVGRPLRFGVGFRRPGSALVPTRGSRSGR